MTVVMDGEKKGKMKGRRSMNCDAHQKISHMVQFSYLLLLLGKEILTSVRSWTM
jgi:hypothetical protein